MVQLHGLGSIPSTHESSHEEVVDLGIRPHKPGVEHLILEQDGIREPAVFNHQALDNDAVGRRGGRHRGPGPGEEAEVMERVVGEAARGERGEVEHVRGGGGRDGGLEREAVQREELLEAARAEERGEDGGAGRQLEWSAWRVRSAASGRSAWAPERSARIRLWKARREGARVGSGSARRTALGDGAGTGGVATNVSLRRSRRDAAAEAASACASGKSPGTRRRAEIGLERDIPAVGGGAAAGRGEGFWLGLGFRSSELGSGRLACSTSTVGKRFS
nr:unnamed protein product [Digitaria exilis]